VKLLAFDTATRSTTVALADSDGGPLIEARDDPLLTERPRHTTLLMPLIADVLQRAGCDWDDIGQIAVGVGPGTFTGLRIGVATARALARTLGIGLVGVSTLHSLALGAVDEAWAQECDAILAVLDARRGEVFAAAWTATDTDASADDRLLHPVAIAPSMLGQVALEVGARRLAIGEGAVAYRALLQRPGTAIADDSSELHRVRAMHHCRLAALSDAAQDGDVRPEYVRAPDAELALRR
jgi:tRNA threonylcarbamoyladenosine biosynthesis protein TsaB